MSYPYNAPSSAAVTAPASVLQGLQGRRVFLTRVTVPGAQNPAVTRLSVNGPSLLRIDNMSLSFSAGDALGLVAFLNTAPTPGTLNQSAGISPVGNYLFLPARGVYIIVNTGASGGDSDGGAFTIAGVLYEDIDPLKAYTMMVTCTPTIGLRSKAYTLAAATPQFFSISDTLGVAINSLACLRLHSFILSNTGAANPMTYCFGDVATAANGHPLAAGATAVIPPGICGMTSLSFFSTLGTTAVITASLR